MRALQLRGAARAALALAIAAGLPGCPPGDEGPEVVEVPCAPSQPAPYADGIPYLGIHANPRGDDMVACTAGRGFVQIWHALQGHAIVQPNTFSPDGATLYVTTTHPDPDGCRLHALDAATGEVLWCRSYDPAIVGGAPEVDADGHLYFTAGPDVVSLDAGGGERWTTTIGEDDGSGLMTGALGVHFTPGGHVATVTNAGAVHLLDRVTGDELAALDIPETWGFVAPDPFDIDLIGMLPSAVQDDVESIFGPYEGGFFGGFFGAGGGFSDNTVAIAPDGAIYVIGGGVDMDHGALVQIHVGGTAAAPTLEPGWALPTEGGSATSPSVTADGRYVTVGDGSSLTGMLQPDEHPSHLRWVDIEACDQGTDADADPDVCAETHAVTLLRGPMPGSPALGPDGTIYLWELSLDVASYGPDAVDVRAEGLGGPVWSAALDGDLTWNSVMTVTEDAVIGTASQVVPSDEDVLGFTLPSTSDPYFVVLDRATGETVERVALTDDSSATVTIGPDGSVYVGMLGLLTMLSVDQRPTLGLIKLSPTDVE